jgi:hypothetical protein
MRRSRVKTLRKRRMMKRAVWGMGMKVKSAVRREVLKIESHQLWSNKILHTMIPVSKQTLKTCREG